MLNSKSEFYRCYIPRLQLVEEDTITRMEQEEEEMMRETMEELQGLDNEWEQRKRNERRDNVIRGAGGGGSKEATKRGAGSRKQGGRPSKTRKYDLIDEDWGVKTTGGMKNDLRNQKKTTKNDCSVYEAWGKGGGREGEGAGREEAAVELLTGIGSSKLQPGAALLEEWSDAPPH